MSEEPHTKVEQERETAVRTLSCPTCAAPAGKACYFGRDNKGRLLAQNAFGHTTRYLLAAEAGLVPVLQGVRHG